MSGNRAFYFRMTLSPKRTSQKALRRIAKPRVGGTPRHAREECGELAARRRGIAELDQSDIAIELSLVEVGGDAQGLVEVRQRLARVRLLHEEDAEAVARIGIERRELGRFAIRRRGVGDPVLRPQRVAEVVVRAGAARIARDGGAEFALRPRRVP